MGDSIDPKRHFVKQTNKQTNKQTSKQATPKHKELTKCRLASHLTQFLRREREQFSGRDCQVRFQSGRGRHRPARSTETLVLDPSRYGRRALPPIDRRGQIAEIPTVGERRKQQRRRRGAAGTLERLLRSPSAQKLLVETLRNFAGQHVRKLIVSHNPVVLLRSVAQSGVVVVPGHCQTIVKDASPIVVFVLRFIRLVELFHVHVKH